MIMGGNNDEGDVLYTTDVILNTCIIIFFLCVESIPLKIVEIQSYMIIITIFIHTYIYLWQHVITTYVRQQQQNGCRSFFVFFADTSQYAFRKREKKKNNIQIMYKNVTMTTSEIDMVRFCNER